MKYPTIEINDKELPIEPRSLKYRSTASKKECPKEYEEMGGDNFKTVSEEEFYKCIEEYKKAHPTHDMMWDTCQFVEPNICRFHDFSLEGKLPPETDRLVGFYAADKLIFKLNKKISIPAATEPQSNSKMKKFNQDTTLDEAALFLKERGYSVGIVGSGKYVINRIHDKEEIDIFANSLIDNYQWGDDETIT